MVQAGWVVGRGSPKLSPFLGLIVHPSHFFHFGACFLPGSSQHASSKHTLDTGVVVHVYHPGAAGPGHHTRSLSLLAPDLQGPSGPPAPCCAIPQAGFGFLPARPHKPSCALAGSASPHCPCSPFSLEPTLVASVLTLPSHIGLPLGHPFTPTFS
ncbi:hypothetical protein H1C71_037689 [Ictidomys tridecemlineatus]|nr:hypothetical protein H1C71_037689 [Ictidomys tridecemlineatus]KAG3277041.1 hypothetical protein H1C71_037689 [Ictidomys tridecemlineatus]